jgi:putative membrane protein
VIVRDHLPLRRIWPRISRRLGVLLLFDTAIAGLYSLGEITWLALPGLPLAMIGGALSVFLAFRNNSSYDRWWEARILWGGLVNTARTFARQVLTLVDEDHPDFLEVDSRRTLVELQTAYVHALRCHLRRQNPFPEFERTLAPDVVQQLRGQRNIPAALLLIMGRVLRQFYDTGRIDSILFMTLDKSLTDLCNIQGACERIKSTPLPRQYDYVPRMVIGVYCVLLPFGLVGEMGMFTPIASTLVSFIFLALDTSGRDIEDPFENTVHDTPMSTLSRMIEFNLRQNLDQETIPNEVKPVEGFLY